MTLHGGRVRLKMEIELNDLTNFCCVSCIRVPAAIQKDKLWEHYPKCSSARTWGHRDVLTNLEIGFAVYVPQIVLWIDVWPSAITSNQNSFTQKTPVIPQRESFFVLSVWGNQTTLQLFSVYISSPNQPKWSSDWCFIVSFSVCWLVWSWQGEHCHSCSFFFLP